MPAQPPPGRIVYGNQHIWRARAPVVSGHSFGNGGPQIQNPPPFIESHDDLALIYSVGVIAPVVPGLISPIYTAPPHLAPKPNFPPPFIESHDDMSLIATVGIVSPVLPGLNSPFWTRPPEIAPKPFWRSAVVVSVELPQQYFDGSVLAVHAGTVLPKWPLKHVAYADPPRPDDGSAVFTRPPYLAPKPNVPPPFLESHDDMSLISTVGIVAPVVPGFGSPFYTKPLVPPKPNVPPKFLESYDDMSVIAVVGLVASNVVCQSSEFWTRPLLPPKPSAPPPSSIRQDDLAMMTTVGLVDPIIPGLGSPIWTGPPHLAPRPTSRLAILASTESPRPDEGYVIRSFTNRPASQNRWPSAFIIVQAEPPRPDAGSSIFSGSPHLASKPSWPLAVVARTESPRPDPGLMIHAQPVFTRPPLLRPAPTWPPVYLIGAEFPLESGGVVFSRPPQLAPVPTWPSVYVVSPGAMQAEPPSDGVTYAGDVISTPSPHLAPKPTWSASYVAGTEPPQPDLGSAFNTRGGVLSVRVPNIQTAEPIIVSAEMIQHDVHDGSTVVSAFISRHTPPAQPIYGRPVIVKGDEESTILCRVDFGRVTFTLPPLLPPSTLFGYYIYSNTGINDPINYTTPIATILGFSTLTWTSSALAFPGHWKFAIRAFNPNGIEQNLNCEIDLILDASGRDITNLPGPPTGLRAFPLKGGNIRVEWAFLATARTKLPQGFHVYIGTGGVPNYLTPVATVSYAAGLRTSFMATLTGLIDDTVYSIGVRAFNLASEEQNAVFVNCTADATGPLPVVDLTGNAVSID